MADNIPLVDSEETEGSDLRMVLVGRTGSRKSATGNTILGRRVFKAELSSSSVTSACQKEMGQFEGQILSVVDTPGLYGTFNTEEELKMEIGRCISFLAPGPHVFLVILRPDRFTNEEQKTVELIQEVFGERSAAYTMVLFTRGDEMEEEGISMEMFISKNPSLRSFVSRCGGRYHFFNNKRNNPEQVRELLEKINRMIEMNGDEYYTNDLLDKAEKAIREKMEKLMRKHPDMTVDEARRRAERKNPVLKLLAAGVVGAGVGAGVGVGVEVAVFASIGALGGPVGAAVGVGVGLAVAGIALAVKKNGCKIQ